MNENWPDMLTIGGAEWEVVKIKVNPGTAVEAYGYCEDDSLRITLQITGNKLWDFHTLVEEILHAGEKGDGLFFGKEEKEAHARLKQIAMHVSRVLVENDLVKL